MYLFREKFHISCIYLERMSGGIRFSNFIKTIVHLTPLNSIIDRGECTLKILLKDTRKKLL